MEDARPQMTVIEAAGETGLERSFLEWALNAGLLMGARDDDGQWRLPYARQVVPDSRAPNSGIPNSGIPDALEKEFGAPLRATQPSAPGGKEDLRQQLADQEARLAEKDRVIAELGLSLARLGEAAAQSVSKAIQQ